MATAASSEKSPLPRAESKIAVPGNRGVKIVRTVTIRKPAAQLYAFWRQLENLPLIIRHPVTIIRQSETTFRWEVNAVVGEWRVNWTAAIINDKSGELIAWETFDDPDVANAGSVRFEPAPADEGTEVTVALEYDPPGGKLGAVFSKFSGDEPGKQVSEALRCFKALMEAGEIPTTEGQSAGEPQRKKKK